MSRLIKVIFTFSILANIVLLGLFFGGGFRIYKNIFGNEFQREIASLPSDVQARIDQVYQTSREEMRALKEEMHAARQDVRDTMNADNFVMRDYERAMDRLNNVRYEMMQVQAKKTGAIAMELSVEDRRRFAGYLLRGGRKGFRGPRMLRKGAAPTGVNAPAQITPASVPPAALSSEPLSAVPAPVKQEDIPQKQAHPFDPVMLPMPEFE